ncbi:glycosyl hydrolase [Nonomuraea sp. NPDC049400]|uniref:glycosyl hydrolase n=1 Tax=Nonomuraea sp. NPDC049400 TaxID=3364352 RepID=UPI00378D2DFF
MDKSLPRRTLLASIGGLAAAGLATPAAARTVRSGSVTVNASLGMGGFPNPAWYISHTHANWYFKRGPLGPKTMDQLKNDFHIKWARVFARPDRYYNPDTGTYDLAKNYPYLDQAASYSSRLHLIISSPSVAKTPALWEEIVRTTLLDHKKRYPQIDSVVPWGEANQASSGDMTPSQFYPFYRAGYRAVNAVNAQLQPAVPIIMGGPGISRPRPEWMNPFFALYAADQDKGKRLDFVCYQSYGLLDTPIQAQSERSRVQSMLSGAGLNPATPVWVTEFGLYGGDTDGGTHGRTPEADLKHDQLVQAAGIAAVSRYYIIGKMNRPFQWVVHHGENLRKDMFVEGLDGVRLPFGHVVVMLGMLKPSLDGERLDMRISPGAAQTDGIGLAALAHADSSRVAVMYWNYQAETGGDVYDTTITVDNLPSNLFSGRRVRIERWLVDATHNNYNYNGTTTFAREMDTTTDTPVTKVVQRVRLAKNAVGLMLLTPR